MSACYRPAITWTHAENPHFNPSIPCIVFDICAWLITAQTLQCKLIKSAIIEHLKTNPINPSRPSALFNLSSSMVHAPLLKKMLKGRVKPKNVILSSSTQPNDFKFEALQKVFITFITSIIYCLPTKTILSEYTTAFELLSMLCSAVMCYFFYRCKEWMMSFAWARMFYILESRVLLSIFPCLSPLALKRGSTPGTQILFCDIYNSKSIK